MTRRLIDADRQREQRRQVALLDRLEARFRAPFARAISAAMRDMVQRYEITGEVMPDQGQYDAVEAVFQRMAVASATTFGGRVFEQGIQKGFAYTMGDGGIGFSGRLDAPYFERKENFAQIMTRLALSYVAQEAVRRKITSIVDTTRNQIIAQVDRGYREGLGQNQIAKSIRDNIPSISRVRGALIARTEVHGAANYGAMVAAKETGLPLSKEWISASDERTRPTHARADGQTVGMDDPFDVGGESLMFPGDPSGSAEEVISCRCSVGYVVSD